MSGTSSIIDSRDGDEEELVSNVRVCARIRPLNNQSKVPEALVVSPPRKRQLNLNNHSNKRSQNDGAFVAWDISDDRTSVSQSIETGKVHGRTHSYTLDRVFGTDATTKEVYQESVASLVKRAMEGYNSTILAYGQTSTGKTHTMTGKRDDPGLIPLCVKDCFKCVRENESNEPREYLFRFSYLEIYKEHIRDLLSSTTSAPEPVRFFDGPDGLMIRGLKEVVVSSPNKVFQLLKQGDKRRQVGATHMNQQSSRSHVVVRLKIESSSTKYKNDETRVSVLSLVDLAGSESVRLNGTERREEGRYINKSLMALGQVVLGLSESSKPIEVGKSKRYIPYRDSKLTRLLQSSLSGNAQMLLLCCISPLASYLEESHNTFKFATRAKRIEQKASIQTAKDKEETLLKTYRNEIEYLKQQLVEAAKQRQQLLEEQRAFKTIMQREQEHTENIQAVATSMRTSNINEADSSIMESTTGEIEELVEAIQTMEQLILKSQPLDQRQSSIELLTKTVGTVQKNTTSLDITLTNKESDGNLHRENPDFMVGGVDFLVDNDADNSVVTPSKSPGLPATQNHHMSTTSTYVLKTPNIQSDLHSELTRVRGLLSNVLQKRGIASIPRNDPPRVESFEHEKIRRNLDFSAPFSDALPARRILDESLSEELEAGVSLERVVGEIDEQTSSKSDDEKDAKLESLRRQLKHQERTTSLRKADSHFLQLQLEEKDMLLEDVSSLLEAVEKRQGELERENLALWREINGLREERGEERGILIRNTPF